MDTKNISFFECDDESYIIVDNYLFNSRFWGMKILTIIMILMLII